jgi:hypothetical protein
MLKWLTKCPDLKFKFYIWILYQLFEHQNDLKWKLFERRSYKTRWKIQFWHKFYFYLSSYERAMNFLRWSGRYWRLQVWQYLDRLRYSTTISINSRCTVPPNRRLKWRHDSIHYRKLRLCRGLFIGPSLKKIFAERRARNTGTHGTASFAEGRAVGRPGPSA